MNPLVILSSLLAVGAVGYLFLGLRLLSGKREIGSLPLGITFLVISYWVIGGAIEQAADSFVVFSIGRLSHFVGTALIPVTIFMCFREYTGKVNAASTVIALLIVPVLSIIVAATNYWHEFMWYLPAVGESIKFLTRPAEFGPWFYFVHGPYSYALLGASVLTLMMHSKAVTSSQRRSLLVLAGSAVVPIIAVIAYDLGLTPNTVSTLPIVFALMLPIYAWLVFGDERAGFTPLAYETVFQNMQDPVIVVDDEERIISLNHGAELLLKKAEADVLRQPLDSVFGADASEVHDAIDTGLPQKMLTTSGRFLHIQVTPIATNNAIASNASVVMFRDVSDVENAQKEVLDSERLLRTLVDHSVNGIVRLRWFNEGDEPGTRTLRCIFANAAAGRYLNTDSHTLTDATADSLLEYATTGLMTDDGVAMRERFADAAARGEVFDTETRVEIDGDAKWLRMIGEPVGDDFALTFVDATDGKAKEKKMESIARSDPLTGVLNRRGFERDAAQLLTQSEDDATGALLFIDLNGFKQINDRYGHEVGDQLLIDAAERLQTSLRSCDIIGRPGGDEFVALVPNVTPAVAEKLATRLTGSLEQEYLIDGQPLLCTASIGLALYPEHANTLTGLLRAADSAMYRAKERSRSISPAGDKDLLEKAV
ncbi:MAG: diguanylate cyclase domain-containing protein [Woeseiaceae bacterium]